MGAFEGGPCVVRTCGNEHKVSAHALTIEPVHFLSEVAHELGNLARVVLVDAAGAREAAHDEQSPAEVGPVVEPALAPEDSERGLVVRPPLGVDELAPLLPQLLRLGRVLLVDEPAVHLRVLEELRRNDNLVEQRALAGAQLAGGGGGAAAAAAAARGRSRERRARAGGRHRKGDGRSMEVECSGSSEVLLG